MEKEMKKLLLVAVSVGIFLLVTITVAIAISTAKMQENTVSSSVPYSNNMNLLPPEPVPVIISTAEPIVDKGNETAETDRNNGDSLTIQIPQPSRAAVPDNPVSSGETVAAAIIQEDKSAVKPVRETSPQETKEKTAQKTPLKETAAVKPAASPKPTTTKSINDYWVQTGAFSSMVRAEDAKDVLFDKGLTSIIETSIINGQNFFRVRLGPYTSENEAKHWLAIVQLIDGFHDSQVRRTVR